VKIKYYLRGIGVGLLLGVIIMYAAMVTFGYEKKSDDEDTKTVVENDVNKGKTEAQTTEKATEKVTTEVKTEKVTTEKTDTTAEVTTEATTEPTTAATTEATTETTTEATTETTTEVTTETTEATSEKTEEPTTEKPSQDDTVTIVIESGMISTDVAEMLQDAGIIDDYKDFDRWLDATGYSTIIRVGEFIFHKGMTYEEIAEVLTTGH
jgi:outer membrane biosynthesis protein TonB